MRNAWLLVGLLLGCGSASFDGVTYRKGDIAFSVERSPSTWRRIDVSGASFAYRDDVGGAVIAVHARCRVDGDDVPLESLTQHLFIYFTEREITDQHRVAVDGREALRSELSAKLDGVSRGFVVYVLKKDGCVYDFMYIGPPKLDRNNVAAFDNYVASFRTIASAGRR